MSSGVTETEPRAPEAKQPSAGESGDAPNSHTACDGLKRLAKRFPKEVAKILDVDDDDQTGDVCCTIYETVNQAMAKNGFACIADVVELIERWEEAETRKRNTRATLKAMQPFLEKPDDAPVATCDLEVDWDERVVVTHKGQVVVASGVLEDQIKRELARMDEQPATT